ncbi:LEAF RUST 10 DISEASE-RESISTANCE LOCUS RECEPTOR-LIKE PROTEIN KINASE-like 2.1 isoform X3 [Cornus florida]|uniref:LEAF RUST 10 DISEASE-RESISTANCE LOCUS RECEPTOR-LIKE PROTEIN KINASE-like 2.1 isoform X3 n=1 Tax=Cornus florida TaxID=4283 RepID=UPI00289E4783|nr:LEAF RUST 10 DISEASE-RESISTANCE LOCUS RECEPTOR-LIKE PROTEIN KINASE-like 2.1 isoform X3 [Cornus florida]
MCGDVNISYPFWKIDGIATDHCGYLGLGIRCSSEKAVLHLHNDTAYHVQRINYDNNTINLVDSSVTTDPNPTYPRELQNLILDSTVPLFHSQLDLDLSFYFNCEIHSLDTGHLPCCGWGGNKSYVFVAGKEPDGVDWRDDCKHKVVTKVLKSEINESDLINGYVEAINKGFVLDWGNARECRTCKESRALCGYANNELSCFCSDGPTKRELCKKGVVSGGIGMLLMSIIICYTRSKTYSYRSIIFWRKQINDNRNFEAFIRNYGSLSPKRYSYSEVKKMTNAFKDKLGQGGYGCVYQGKLVDNRLVAVKLLDASKGNGEDFINEVASIGRTSHVNIVTFLGFCLERSKRALIYEFMSNGSLEKFIYGEGLSKINGHLGWEKLYQISIGIARGLEYLHRGCSQQILHFDIKPHNILLDEDFCPKISDFGLAKLCTKKESIISTLEARGTIGYIAPEVFSRNFGRVSHKSDVYSYGMMTLEMVGGRKNVDIGESHTSQIYFPHWVYKRLELDEELGFQGDMTEEENEMARKMIFVGLWCIQTDPSQRPSISRVLEMLEGSIEALEIPPKPYLYSPSRSAAESSTT